MSFWLTKVFANNTRRVFSFSLGNKGQLENADWTIGLLSRFLTLRLHYSIASLRLRLGAFVPVTFSPGIPFSRAGVNLFPLSFPLRVLSLRSSLSSSLSPPCTPGPPKRFSRMPRGWNIRLPNYWKQQRRTVSLRRTPPWSLSFSVYLCPLQNLDLLCPINLPFSLLIEAPRPLWPNLRYAS